MTEEDEKGLDETTRILKELSNFQVKGWNEETVKMKIVIPLLQALGYSDQKLGLEYNYSSDRPDIIVDDPSVPLVVEVKGTNENLNRHVSQIKRYSCTFSSFLAILTNGNQFYIFSPCWRYGDFKDRIILSFTLKDLEKQDIVERLKLLLSVSEGKKRLEYIRNIEEEITKKDDQVDKLDSQISSLEEEKRSIEERYPEGIDELKRLYDYLGAEVKEDIKRHREIIEQIKNLVAETRLTQQQVPSRIGSPDLSEIGRPNIVRSTPQPRAASSEDFSMGIVDEVINIIALQQGKQIVLCKKNTKSDDYVFILPKTTFRSKYTPSEFGRNLENEPIDPSVCNYVAKLEYLEIPGRNRKFWEELYEIGEFNLWEIDEGPLKYFENFPPSPMLFWILRVYEMPFEIKKGPDFTTPHMLSSRIINDSTLKRIQQGFKDFKPVLSKDEFEKKLEVINQIGLTHLKYKIKHIRWCH